MTRIEGVVAEWQERTQNLPANVRKLCMDRVRRDADILKRHIKGMLSNGFSGPALKLIVDRALGELEHSMNDFCRQRDIALQKRVVTKQRLDLIDSALDNALLPARASAPQRTEQATTTERALIQRADDHSSNHVQEREEVPGLDEIEEYNKKILKSNFKQLGVKTPSTLGAIEAGAKAQVPEGEENVVRYKVLSGGAKYISKFIPGLGQAELAAELAQEYEPGLRTVVEGHPLTGDFIEHPAGTLGHICHFDADPAADLHMLHGALELAKMTGDGIKSLRQGIVNGSAAVCDRIGLTDQNVVKMVESYGYRSTAEFQRGLGEKDGMAYASMQAHME